MKNPIIISILALASILWIGCNTIAPKTSALPKDATPAQKTDALKADIIGHLSNPSVQSATEATLALAGKQALRRAVDDSDRQMIAAQMWTISDAFLTLAGGGEVTPAKVEATVQQWVSGWSDPSKNDLIDSANLVWQVIYPQLVTADQSGLWKAWLGVFARSARNAASGYYNEVHP